MQSGSPSFGTPESAIGLLCTGQIARHYGLPFRGGGALTSSQTVDAQAAYEAMMTMLADVPRRRELRHALGRLARVGPRLLLREVRRRHRDPADARRRSSRRSRSTRRRLAFDAHQEVGQGGHFLGAAHTLERFRDCFYRPLLSSTENFERWNAATAARDAAARASEIWRETLEEYEQPPLDDGMRAELKAYVDRRRTELGD